MIVLTARDLARQFDFEPLFQQVTFDVRPGEKIGIVGPNGVGKSTLMNILAGKDDADVGSVEWHPDCRYGLLEQHPDFAPGRTLIEEARLGLADLFQLHHESEQLAHLIAEGKHPDDQERLHKRFDAVQSELHRLQAYNLDHRVDEVLQGLGFSPDRYDQPVDKLSGGQQNRLLLAKLLLIKPDVLLLDEPTNHLDIAATEWLESYLAASDQTLLIVSHDRYFLDKVTNRILELSRRKVQDYPGNFSAYWRQRDERLVVQQRQYEKQQEEIADMQDFIRKNIYGQKSTQAHDREKKLARMELVEKPLEITSDTNIVFGKVARTADCTIETRELSQGFGSQNLFDNLSLRIMRGDRWGFFGPNGCGKTTLLRTILGDLPPRSGEVRFGTGVKIGYFDQQLASVDSELDLIEAIRPPGRPEITPAQLRDQLARFGLKGEIVFQKVGSLSGGERNKVALAKISMLNVNLLILDEPTNHLDLWACAALEQALREYEGTILFVSHDRYFIDQVATRVLTFEADRVCDFEGNYSTWLDTKRRREEENRQRLERQAASNARRMTETPNTEKPAKRKRKFPYRRAEEIELEIAQREEEVARLQENMAKPEVLRDGNLTKQTMQAYEAEKTALANLYEHWEEALELNG